MRTRSVSSGSIFVAAALGVMLLAAPARADVPPPRAGCSLRDMKKGQECIDCKVRSSTDAHLCDEQLGAYGFEKVCDDWGYMHGIWCRAPGGKALPNAMASAVGTGGYEPSETPPEPEPTTTATTPKGDKTSKPKAAAAPSPPSKTGCGACTAGLASSGDAASAAGSLASLALAALVVGRRRARR